MRVILQHKSIVLLVMCVSLYDIRTLVSDSADIEA